MKNIRTNTFKFPAELNILIPLLMFVFLFAQPTLADKNKKWIKKGDKLFEAGNYPQALDLYQNVNMKTVSNIEFFVHFGESFFHCGDYVKASKFLGKAIEMNESPDASHYLSYARALHCNLEYEKAILAYEKWGKLSNKTELATFYVQTVRNAKKFTDNATKATITRLDGEINSGYPDYRPSITASGKKMYFMSRRPFSGDKKRADDKLPFARIYSSGSRNNWKNIDALNAPINDEGFRDLAGISANGKMLFLYKEENGGDLYYSKYSRGKWSVPKPMPSYINTTYHESSASLSPDGRTLYYIHGKKGDYDIYTTNLDRKGVWSNPVPLELINTKNDEATPFIHADGKTLYFSSKGYNSMGGFDVFRTVRRSDGSWSKPENMGSPVNSPADETGFVLMANGKTGYYALFKNGGKGFEDIYSIELEKSLANLTLYKGKVIDPNGKPLCAKITITDYDDENQTFDEVQCNCETGEFETTLPSGHSYGILVESDPYIFFSDNVWHDETAGYFEEDTTIQLRAPKSGEKVILTNVHFKKKSDEVTEAAKIELDKLATYLINNPDFNITVAGHTDNSELPGYSLLISQKRANNISTYLKIKGVGTSRIKAQGYGDREPISTNKTEEGRRKNNRIEIWIQ